MSEQVPMVGYLELGEEPRLISHQCEACGARFFDRRNACGSCGGRSFGKAALPRKGILKTFTIVHFCAPGIKVPFVAGVVDCGGTSVRTNIVDVEPDPVSVKTGMEVELVTRSFGFDSLGKEAISYAFAPVH